MASSLVIRRAASLAWCVLAITACKRDRGRTDRAAAQPAAGSAPPSGGAAATRSAAPIGRAGPVGRADPVGEPLTETAQLANRYWADRTCTPDAAAGQRAGTATLELHGDDLDVAREVPAVCGGLHTAATQRFAVGDGTLYRACLPDGSVLQVSADVALAGNVGTTYRYENYRSTGPLIELFRKDVGTYNQRDDDGVRPGEVVLDNPSLVITEDGSADLRVALQWPGYKQVGPRRIINAVARWTCPR